MNQQNTQFTHTVSSLGLPRSIRGWPVQKARHESANVTPAADHQNIEIDETLSLFNRMSVQLAESYRNLEKKVTQLNGELSSEVKQRQAELEAKEQLANRLETLLDILPAGVVVLDGKGVVEQCNPAALDLLGEPLEGQAWVDVIRRCFAPRHDDGHEVSLKDGRRVRIETRSMANGPGQLILLSDLTETRELQAKVSRAERLSSLGRMVASLAHQIRTPLSAAMLYAGHLSQPGLTERLRVSCAEKLQSRLTHLEQQIRDMLIFAKGESRIVENMTLSTFIQSLQQAAEAPVLQSKVAVRWQLPERDVSFLCNRESLVGACLNLINNSLDACRAVENANLAIRIALNGDSALKIEILDNGPGFQAHQKEQILEAFYTTKTHGTGLGLAVVQAVVKAHSGSFDITSTPDGARATIILPLVTRRSVDEVAVGE